MVIGRSEDRDNPWNPLVLRHHVPVWDPIRVTHLGQRSCDRTTQAGHMAATDQSHRRCQHLARRGPSTYGFCLQSAPRIQGVHEPRKAQSRSLVAVGPYGRTNPIATLRPPIPLGPHQTLVSSTEFRFAQILRISSKISSLGVYGGMNENFVLVVGRSRWQADGV